MPLSPSCRASHPRPGRGLNRRRGHVQNQADDQVDQGTRGVRKEDASTEWYRGDDRDDPVNVWVRGEGKPEETDWYEYGAGLAYDKTNFGWWIAVVLLSLLAKVSNSVSVK